MRQTQSMFAPKARKDDMSEALKIRHQMQLNPQLANSFFESPERNNDTSWWEEQLSYRDLKYFDPKQYIVSGKTEKEIMQYRQIFEYLDHEKNGFLTPKELRLAMEKLFPNRRDLRNVVIKIFSDFDDDGSGEIDFGEFVNLIVKKPCEKDTEDDIRGVFEQIDLDGKEYLTVEDFRILAEDQNDNITDEEIQEIMLKVDPKNKGEVMSWQAFLNFNRNFSLKKI